MSDTQTLDVASVEAYLRDNPEPMLNRLQQQYFP